MQTHAIAETEKSNAVAVYAKNKQQPFFAPAYVQPKLTIGPVDDPYEREADAMADKVMRMSDEDIIQTKSSPVSIQRKCADCEEEEKLQRKCAQCEEEEKLQRKETNNNATIADASTESYISSLNGKGRSLTQSERSFFEPRFGYDFSDVQVHTNTEANQSAKSINALAYTHGNNIVFAAGQYQSNTHNGKQLMAHELMHVVQQEFMQPSAAIQRYGHDVETCKQSDLEKYLWPGDALARAWLNESIATLNKNPLPDYVIKLLQCYFMTDIPDLNKIKDNLNIIQSRFASSDYFYTCLENCESSGDNATMGGTHVSWLFGGSGPIILCMNNIRTMGLPSVCAHTIIHEFAHRYLDFSGDTYCSDCCQDISSSDALKNPDSYAGLVQGIPYERQMLENKKKIKKQKKESSKENTDTPNDEIAITSDSFKNPGKKDEFKCEDFKGNDKLKACLNDEDRLEPGTSDVQAVEKVQQALNQNLKENNIALVVDGKFGAETGKAVQFFKAKHKLGFTQFPDVGPGTMKKLDELCGPTIPKEDSKEILVTIKSYIAPIGINTGFIFCPSIDDPTSAAANIKLRSLGLATDLKFSENPTTDAKDKGYRLFSSRKFIVHFNNNAITDVIASKLDTDTGKEGPLQAPPLTVTQDSHNLSSPTEYNFGWVGKGQPHSAANIPFNLVCPRKSVFIWHELRGKIQLIGGIPDVTFLALSDSKFPSDRVFVNNILKITHQQGAFKQLWVSSGSDPSLVE